MFLQAVQELSDLQGKFLPLTLQDFTVMSELAHGTEAAVYRVAGKGAIATRLHNREFAMKVPFQYQFDHGSIVRQRARKEIEVRPL